MQYPFTFFFQIGLQFSRSYPKIKLLLLLRGFQLFKLRGRRKGKARKNRRTFTSLKGRAAMREFSTLIEDRGGGKIYCFSFLRVGEGTIIG